MKDTVVGVRFSVLEKKQLEEAAAKRGQSVSQFVRECVRRELGQDDWAKTAQKLEMLLTKMELELGEF